MNSMVVDRLTPTGIGGQVGGLVLDVLQQAGGDVGRDAVDVDDKGPRLALEDHILDAGDFQ